MAQLIAYCMYDTHLLIGQYRISHCQYEGKGDKLL